MISFVGWSKPIVDKSSPLKLISDKFNFIDGAAWDGASSLYIPDLKDGLIYRYMPQKDSMSVFAKEMGRVSGTFYQNGKLFLSNNGDSNIAFLNFKKKQKVKIAGQSLDAKPPARPNDIVVDKWGGVYYTLTRQGQVIYIDPNGHQTVAVEGIETPNGLTLSPSGHVLYVSSFVPKKIWKYKVKSAGQVGEGVVFASMTDGDAKGADGMCIDRAGNVYCAGANDIWIWNPNGDLLDKIACPTRPINCTFGNNDLRTLYIVAFGGLYEQKMNAYGVAPHKPSKVGSVSLKSSQPSTVVPKEVGMNLDVVYAKDGTRELRTDIFYPKNNSNLKPAIIFVHGGGWLKGNKQVYRAMAIDLAKQGFVTSAIEYRLGHEAAFPAGIQDCFASVRFLRANSAKYHIDKTKIGVVGGSAGGHLAGLMATGHENSKLIGAYGHTEESSKVQAAVVMAGPMEMTTGSVAERSKLAETNSNAYVWLEGTLSEKLDLYKLADAKLQIDKNDSPVLFMAGEHDLPERNEPFRKVMKENRLWSDVISYKNGKHGCWNRLPWYTDMTKDVIAFFKKQL